MKDLARWAKQHNYEWEVAWTTELGSNTGMIHIHAIQHGSFIPQAKLQDRWGAIVDIRRVNKTDGKVANYIAKGGGRVANYMAKSGNTQFREWSNLNGGRPLHWSRGYFHGLGIQEAIRVSKLSCASDERKTFRLPFPSEMRRVLGCEFM